MRFFLLIGILSTCFVVDLGGQIGKSYSEVQRIFGKESIPNLGLRREGFLIVEDKKINSNEVRMIMYDEDSVVVAASIGYKDSSLTDSVLMVIKKQEIPKFQNGLIGRDSHFLYKKDTVNNILMMMILSDSGYEFPYIGVFILVDPRLVDGYSRVVEFWELDEQ